MIKGYTINLSLPNKPAKNYRLTILELPAGHECVQMASCLWVSVDHEYDSG